VVGIAQGNLVKSGPSCHFSAATSALRVLFLEVLTFVVAGPLSLWCSTVGRVVTTHVHASESEGKRRAHVVRKHDPAKGRLTLDGGVCWRGRRVRSTTTLQRSQTRRRLWHDGAALQPRAADLLQQRRLVAFGHECTQCHYYAVLLQ